jgi:hypothetical protein
MEKTKYFLIWADGDWKFTVSDLIAETWIKNTNDPKPVLKMKVPLGMTHLEAKIFIDNMGLSDEGH